MPQLRLRHLIPPGRLTLPYLCRIAEGCEFSSRILRFIREGLVPPDAVNVGLPQRLRMLVRRLRGIPPALAIERAKLAGRERARAMIGKLTAAPRADAAVAHSNRLSLFVQTGAGYR